MNNDKRIELESAIKAAQLSLEGAEHALDHFLSSPENNSFISLSEAEEELDERLIAKAHKACEKRGCFGLDKYTQRFTVDDEEYLATLEVEWNRHDKTYYYIDQSDFSIEKIKDYTQIRATNRSEES